jgi:DNA-binding response OmpR family regulator
MKVLLVEDDAITAKTVERMIASQGYDCDTTAYGEDAVALASHKPYDVILLDVMLPDIDGYEVLRRLHQARVDTPIVIQSGVVSRDDLEKGHSFGVPDFLLKPYSQHELSARIDSAVRRGQSGPPARASDDEFERREVARDGDDMATRRQHPRVRTLKRGQIIYRQSSCTLDCLVLNISDGGAALQPADFVELPETFLLKLEHGPTHRCEVCWRHGNKMGVRFLN